MEEHPSLRTEERILQDASAKKPRITESAIHARYLRIVRQVGAQHIIMNGHQTYEDWAENRIIIHIQESYQSPGLPRVASRNCQI
jgi:hypothetical protein